jgi:hypothetical protein
VGIMLTVTAGCGDKETRAEESPATPTLSAEASATRTVDPVAAGSQAAMAAYRGMWDAFIAASNAGATAPPALVESTAGTALAKLNKGLALNKSRGQTTRGKPTMAPSLTSIGPTASPTSATIIDCVDGSRWLLYKSNGQLADDEPGGRRRVTATVTRTSQTWKVTSFAIQQVGTC